MNMDREILATLIWLVILIETAIGICIDNSTLIHGSGGTWAVGCTLADFFFWLVYDWKK